MPPGDGAAAASPTPQTCRWQIQPHRSPTSTHPRIHPAPGPSNQPQHSEPAKVLDDLNMLLEFCDYPAEHWVHLRTTNPIESIFATVRIRQRVTKGPGSRTAGIAMAFKLLESAQTRRRDAANAPHLVTLVRAGATFDKGTVVDHDNDQSSDPGYESGGDQQVA